MNGPTFFPPRLDLTVADIARLTGANLLDPAHAGIGIGGVASVGSARNTDLVFVDGKRFTASLDGLSAAAVLCGTEVAHLVPKGIAVLVTASPQRAFAQAATALHPDAVGPHALTSESGISPSAIVDPTAELEPGVIVEAGAVIAADAAIGSGTVIAPGAVIGRGCRLGRNCLVGPQAVVQNALVGNRVILHGGAQIGQDGFGYVPGKAGPEKIPQIGRVVIQDGVEIGANTTVDRGALDDTVIGENTKIDNLVQIAHNVRIGRNCLIASHCGISGSVTLGDNVLLGGRVGLADHITIGSGAQLAAASGVMNDVPPGEKWCGTPAQPIKDFWRGVTALRRLASARGRKEAHG